MTSHRTPARPRTARTPRALAVAVLLLALAGCSGSATSAPTTSAPPAATSTTADALEIADPWVKAADDGMTAAFGVLRNTSDTDVRLVSATSSVAGTCELHEMAEGDDGAMVMRPKAGGVVVPAGGEHALAPGGDHIMLMDLLEPVLPGQDVTVTLTAEDGSTFEFTAPGRSFAGAEEEYDGGTGEGGTGGADDGATEDAGAGHDS